MKQKGKIIALTAVVIVFTAVFIWNNRVKIPTLTTEKRAVFISYIEYAKHFDNKSEKEIKQEIQKMVKTITSYHLNSIILQVRPFSDAIYPSEIFPSSHTISGKEGSKLPFDILEYFIEQAHQHQIELHAWINPYRIRNDTDITKISNQNPAYQWLSTNHVKIIKDKGIFYNPASSEVEDLIVSGIEEIVSNYSVDGIHLDDYFYPDQTIDLENYQPFQNTISLTDYRLSNTNQLVHRIYESIKKINPKVVFGISPEGNIQNNYQNNYADIKTWIQQEGYVDYIMPQLYYGFFNEAKPFIATLNEWQDLIKIKIDLIPALALYKSGTADEYAKSGKEEWLNSQNIISKQIKVLRKKETITGFSLFRYDYLLPTTNSNLDQEQQNLREVLTEDSF